MVALGFLMMALGIASFAWFLSLSEIEHVGLVRDTSSLKKREAMAAFVGICLLVVGVVVAGPAGLGFL